MGGQVMKKLLSESLLDFIQALLKDQPVVLHNGYWHVEGACSPFL